MLSAKVDAAINRIKILDAKIDLILEYISKQERYKNKQLKLACIAPYCTKELDHSGKCDDTYKKLGLPPI